ncbi:MAG: OmpA family protein [Cellvibrionaceae bacterium]|nr:OmpA family protein [Cellvibrionaceae bacterium]
MKNTLITVAATGLIAAAMSASTLGHNVDGYVSSTSGAPVKTSSGSCVLHAGGATDSVGCDVDVAAAPAPVAKPAPKAEPAPVAPKYSLAPERKRVEQAVSLSGDTLFATNSDQLSSAGQAELDQLVANIGGPKGVDISKIDVIGHADSRGADAYNQALSERRATSVGNYLIAKGIDSALISTSGRGETDPVASNETAAGRAQNRRVDISLTGVKTVYK